LFDYNRSVYYRGIVLGRRRVNCSSFAEKYTVLRVFAVVIVIGLLSSGLRAQDAGTTRYKVDPDLDNYPQKTAKEALESIIKAIDAKQIDYLVAQLADPQFVDMRVKMAAGGFPDIVGETRARLADDPSAVKELRRFLKEGQWEEM